MPVLPLGYHVAVVLPVLVSNPMQAAIPGVRQRLHTMMRTQITAPHCRTVPVSSMAQSLDMAMK